MNERINESISALMDDEANELELQRLLRQSGQPEVREVWQRYHLTRFSLHGTARGLDVSAAVMAAIEAETSAPEPAARHPRLRKLRRPPASFSVAASVLAAVLAGGLWYSLEDETAATGNRVAGQVPALAEADARPGPATYVSSPAPVLQPVSLPRQFNYNRLADRQLQRYLKSHIDEAALNTPQGMMPYARVIAQHVED